jgi:hypothetical protein
MGSCHCVNGHQQRHFFICSAPSAGFLIGHAQRVPKVFQGGFYITPPASGGTFLFRQSRKCATMVNGIQFNGESYFYGLNGHFAQFDFR